MTTTTDATLFREAAELIGAKVSEIAAVDLDTPAGCVIQHTDGSILVLVDEDAPDAEGKSGLMFLVAPSENYQGTFPVYAQPLEDDEEDLDDDGQGGEEHRVNEPARVPPTELTVPEEALETVKALQAWVEADPAWRAAPALAAEQAGKNRPSAVLPLQKLVDELLELAAAGQDDQGGAGDTGAAGGDQGGSE
jgi:hypothetical protein